MTLLRLLPVGKINIDAGFLYYSNFSDITDGSIARQGYILSQIAMRVKDKFTCTTGGKINPIAMKAFYTSIDICSRRKEFRGPCLSVGAQFDRPRNKFEAFEKLSKHITLVHTLIGK